MRKITCSFGGAFLAMCLTSCRSANAPTTTPSAPTVAVTVPTSPGTISGIVADGNQPLAGVQVDNGYGPNSWVFTDASGIFHLPANASVHPMQWVRAGKAGYAQPCAAPVSENAPVMVQMVSRAALTGAPQPSPSGFRTVSGDAVQMTSSGTQTVAGVWVDFEPDLMDDWPAAVTFTDASGRFSLCGLPTEAVGIGAAVGNSYGYVTVPPGQTTIEITLR